MATLEVASGNPKTLTFLAHSNIPITFTRDDFDHAVAGNLVVKVVYLPDRENQDFLTVVGGIPALPTVGMYYGLHEWTARHTGGVVDARFIALIDTALESPLGQIAMIPMLAWIANSAPANLKATYFAVMASFSNLALSASALGTKYLNQVFTVKREVVDRATGVVKVQQDYSELGWLMITVIVLNFTVPVIAIALFGRRIAAGKS